MPPPRSPVRPLLACAILIGPPSLAGQPSSFADSITAAAARAIETGRPWQATRLLAPLTRNPAATPEAVVLTSAVAAARWEGWATVVQLLYQRSWLDQDSTGTAHALLGRALVERGQPQTGLGSTRAALKLASPSDRAAREITHARALDRLGLLDSAAVHYRAAAAALPLVADWLTLRAAGVVADSTTRARWYETVTNEVARNRIAWTEALARERTGDSIGAARRYQALGARVAAARLRLGRDSGLEAAVRADLLALIAPGRPAEEVAEAIALFDRAFPRRTPSEELRIARRAAVIDLLERAGTGFAIAGRSLTDRDRFTYATVLSRLGRFEQALPLFDQVRTPHLQADAAYQRARMLIRNGQATRGLRSLREIPARFPTDSEPAASALFLLGDLEADRGADDSARALFREAGSRYSATPYGQRAAFQAALIAFVTGDLTAALGEFDAISRSPSHGEATAAAYWAARTAERAGDSAAARQRFTALVARSREGYYPARAARRLGTPLLRWPPATTAPQGDSPPGLARARALLDLGLRTEARFELDAVIAAAGTNPERMLATAGQLAAERWHAQALRVTQRAQAAGAGWTRAVADLLYPLPFRDLLLAETRGTRAGPFLVAGLIRQESLFDPTARSLADARGLMQVLPSVGAAFTKPLGIEWDPALLYQPDLNLDLGIRHLEDALAELAWPERALAAYNGGLDRVRRWQSIRGVTGDPEVFVERIPFAETRDYVRKVLGNEAMYAALYGEQP